MSHDQWHQMIALFYEAVVLPREEWDAFLSQACGGDQKLQKILKSLLEADNEAGDFLEYPLLSQFLRYSILDKISFRSSFIEHLANCTL